MHLPLRQCRVPRPWILQARHCQAQQCAACNETLHAMCWSIWDGRSSTMEPSFNLHPDQQR